MNRRSVTLSAALLATAAAGVTTAACDALFGDAVQCSTNEDCTDFGPQVTCSAEGMCLRGGAAGEDGGPTLPDGRDGASGEEDSGLPPLEAGPVDPACALPFDQKPKVDVGAVADTPITTDTVWSCKNTYVLKGRVYLGAKLTIERGTTIVGDSERSALIVWAGRGADLPRGTLEALGDYANPVVFTSSKPAGMRAPNDWGGVYVLGKASGEDQLDDGPILQFGAATPVLDDSSGTLRYVRIEYGHAGLILAGVGSKTTVDHVQVRKTGPTDHPCFDIEGGRVNLKYLVCQSGANGLFTFARGYQGKAQFLLGQRAEQGNGLRVQDGETKLTLFNATILGKPQAMRTGTGLYLSGAEYDINNTVVQGFRPGLDIVGGATTRAIKGTYFFQNGPNVAFNEDDGGLGDASVLDPNSPQFNDDEAFDENGFVLTAASMNLTNMGLGNPYDLANPLVAPDNPFTTGRQVPPNDGFFTPSALYVGALQNVGDAWMKGGWAVFSAD